MRFPRKSWFFAGVLSTIFVLTMASSAFCETPGIPTGFEDIEAQIYASQEDVYATSLENKGHCGDCHYGIVEPHHYGACGGGDPNNPYNPYCPDPPPSQCTPCHFDYVYDEINDQCQTSFAYPANSCVACHALSVDCPFELEFPAQCFQLGPCAGLPQTPVATIDIDPDTLNLKCKGNWITCYIELSEGHDVNQIDVNTVTLSVEGATPIEAALSPTEVGDYDSDDIPDLMVKFDRGAVQAVVTPGSVEMTVTGSLTDGTAFYGTDTVLVIDKGKEHTSEADHSSVVY